MRTRLLSLLLVLSTQLAYAGQPAKAPSGGELAGPNGERLPLLSSDADILVTGDVATVRVTQRFANDSAKAISARYLFPLPHDSAVHAMTMTVGDEVVRAVIQKVEEAKAKFEEAKREGKTAALLEEHRANVFTQDVANIPPSEEVKIEIEYAQAVPREDGRYQLHFPMVVGSRYDNGANGIVVPELDKRLPAGAYHHEAGGIAAPPKQQRRVSVRVRLETGIPIRGLRSPTHQIESDERGASSREVVLGAGRIADDRDFVLEYELAGERTGGGLITHEDERGGFFTLLLEPPPAVLPSEVRARELVFVIDASCSMEGAPLDTSKRLVSRMLAAARPDDSFRIIVFGSEAHALQREAVPPTKANLARARAQLENLGSLGGTEIELGLKAALQPETHGDRMRLVVFLTDGYIGNEASVMATINAEKRDARLFAFGIGSSVNRWLIEEMAVAGAGVGRVVGLDEDLDRVADGFADRLQSPFLTDGWIDFGKLEVTEVTPMGPIDLYAGAPVRVMGRLAKGAKLDGAKVSLAGTAGGEAVKIPLSLARASGEGGAAAIPVLWARARIAEHMRDLAAPRFGGGAEGERQRIVERITKLGLDFAITTRWTAFLAVSERKVSDPALATAAVPVSQPHGSAAPAAFSGSSTPEPAEWAAMLLLMALAAVFVRRRADA